MTIILNLRISQQEIILSLNILNLKIIPNLKISPSLWRIISRQNSKVAYIVKFCNFEYTFYLIFWKMESIR